MRFREIIEFIQGKLLPIIAEKDSSKKEALIVNLTLAIRKIEGDYPLTMPQIETLQQIERILAKEFYITKNPFSADDNFESELDDFLSDEEELENESNELLEEEEKTESALNLDGVLLGELRELFNGLFVVVTEDRNESGIAQGSIKDVKVAKTTLPINYSFDFETQLDSGKISKFTQILYKEDIEEFISRKRNYAFNFTTDFTDWDTSSPVKFSSGIKIDPVITEIKAYVAEVQDLEVVDDSGITLPLGNFQFKTTKYEYPNNTFYKLDNGEETMFISQSIWERTLANPSLTYKKYQSAGNLMLNIFYQFAPDGNRIARRIKKYTLKLIYKKIQTSPTSQPPKSVQLAKSLQVDIKDFIFLLKGLPIAEINFNSSKKIVPFENNINYGRIDEVIDVSGNNTTFDIIYIRQDDIKHNKKTTRMDINDVTSIELVELITRDRPLKGFKRKITTPISDWDSYIDTQIGSASPLSNRLKSGIKPITKDIKPFFKIELNVKDRKGYDSLIPNFTPSSITQFEYQFNTFYQIKISENVYFFMSYEQFFDIDMSRTTTQIFTNTQKLPNALDNILYQMDDDYLGRKYIEKTSYINKYEITIINTPKKAGNPVTKSSKKTNKSGQGRKTNIDWIDDLNIVEAEKDILKDWFTQDGSFNEISVGRDKIFAPSRYTNNHIDIYLENKNGSNILFSSMNFINTKLTKRYPRGRNPVISKKEFNSLKAFNTALKKSLIENYDTKVGKL